MLIIVLLFSLALCMVPYICANTLFLKNKPSVPLRMLLVITFLLTVYFGVAWDSYVHEQFSLSYIFTQHFFLTRIGIIWLVISAGVMGLGIILQLIGETIFVFVYRNFNFVNLKIEEKGINDYFGPTANKDVILSDSDNFFDSQKEFCLSDDDYLKLKASNKTARNL